MPEYTGPKKAGDVAAREAERWLEHGGRSPGAKPATPAPSSPIPDPVEQPDREYEVYRENLGEDDVFGWGNDSPANQLSGPADLELDDKGDVVNPGLTWSNAGTELPDRIAQAMAKFIGPQTEQRKMQNELAVLRARNEIDQKAIPLAEAAKQRSPVMAALAHQLTYRDRAEQNRQPIQMQREFSNDQEKEAYLDRVRQAQAKTK